MLQLNINVVGFQIHKSSKKQFWPISCYVEENPKQSPFIVALFCGNSKPLVQEFLSDLVTELTDLQQNGLVYKKIIIR